MANKAKKFFETFPNGAITCKNIVVQCKDCKNLMTVPELALYIPKEGYDPAKMNRNISWTIGFSAKEYDYIAPNELKKIMIFLNIMNIDVLNVVDILQSCQDLQNVEMEIQIDMLNVLNVVQ